jgi:putative polyketide hydroxylase
MNVGIADVHNLCWKLAGAVHGWAAPSLLETYEPERQPVAHRNLHQAVENARLMVQARPRSSCWSRAIRAERSSCCPEVNAGFCDRIVA